MREYFFTNGCPLRVEVNQQKLGEEIENMPRTNGALESQTYVDYARNNPDSEAYKTLEWDDSIAAENWRKEQARAIIRAVRYRDISDHSQATDVNETIPVVVRPYYNLERGKGYEDINVILADADKHKKLLNNAREDMIRYREKYFMLEELKPIFEQIDKFIKEI